MLHIVFQASIAEDHQQFKLEEVLKTVNEKLHIIQFQDFHNNDLRIDEIIEAEHIEVADKLLRLTLSLGNEHKQVFAGIKAAYKPEELIGKMTIMIANLKPRKMRFGISEGMILAAGPGGKDIWLLEPHQGAMPGMQVK